MEGDQQSKKDKNDKSVKIKIEQKGNDSPSPRNGGAARKAERVRSPRPDEAERE